MPVSRYLSSTRSGKWFSLARYLKLAPSSCGTRVLDATCHEFLPQ